MSSFIFLIICSFVISKNSSKIYFFNNLHNIFQRSFLYFQVFSFFYLFIVLFSISFKRFCQSLLVFYSHFAFWMLSCASVQYILHRNHEMILMFTTYFFIRIQYSVFIFQCCILSIKYISTAIYFHFWYTIIL